MRHVTHARDLRGDSAQSCGPRGLRWTLAKWMILAAGLGLIGWSIESSGGLSEFLGIGKYVSRNVHWNLALLLAAAGNVVFIWRLVLWMRYRPMPSPTDERLPSISVIIPAFNEESLVRNAIASTAASRYPTDRLEIIAIDDGSTDDTWRHMQAVARGLEGDVSIHLERLPRNRGKRAALHRGFELARGDVFVTVDSDCVLDPEALRNAVAPLLNESDIGCVAGCVRVLNADQSVFTRFLKGTFNLSFKYVRAYQNAFRGIFCTPGALSVYRADVVRRVADEWLDQRFLGRPCMTGEDRAMTNLFLRDGWMTAYQQNAVVWARMPHTYGGVCRMFLRWARSNIRETLQMFSFLLTGFRRRHLRVFQFNMLLAAISLFLPALAIVNGVALAFTADGYLLKQAVVLATLGLSSALICWINERDSEAAWLVLYYLFWPIGFAWILPYAALTLRNNGWLTRGRRPTPIRAFHVEQPSVPLAPAVGVA